MRLLADDEGITRLRVRTVLTCETVSGVCSKCYGRMLATGKISDLGEAIGIVAAQSIGEPGTQLTMRTFHTGGVAGEDITHGLPRVVELFEARTPKAASLLADVSGVVRIGENEKGERVITIVADDGTELEYAVSRRAHVSVREGQEVTAGDRLVGDEKSPLDPKKLLEIKGVRETQQYLVDEVQRVYRDQGVSIHDKHIEVIVRQMLRRVTVSEPGDSAFLPGEKVDARRYAEENRRLVEEGKRPAEGRPELMGITKASLATDSWLSAASFQETTRVLTEAAIEGRSDGLEGLKENVIIGKLIPAGTGMPMYRNIRTEAPEYEPLPFYTSEVEEEMDLATWLREASSNRQAEAELATLPAGAEAPVAVDAVGAEAARSMVSPPRRSLPGSVTTAEEMSPPETDVGCSGRTWGRSSALLVSSVGSERLGALRGAPEVPPVHVRREFPVSNGKLQREDACPRSPSSSVRDVRRRPRRPRRRPSRAPRSVAACARASSRRRPRSRTPRCARSRGSGSRRASRSPRTSRASATTCRSTRSCSCAAVV